MLFRLVAQTIVMLALWGSLLFAGAGTLHWRAAWIFIAEMLVLSLVGGLWLARRDPALLRERLTFPIAKDQPGADKALVVVLILTVLGFHVLMGLDAVRFGWSFVPPWVRVIGALTLVPALWISVLVLRENSFAATAVKIQRDRGQTVIDTGPYRHVRHPMYSGALLYFAGMTLQLGSWWGLVGVLALAVVFGIRTGIEEDALRAGLEGYEAYAARVRYRLIPGAW